MKTKTETFFTMLFIAMVSALVTYYFVQPTPQANVAQIQQGINTVKKQEQAIEKRYSLSLKKLQKENDSLKKLVDFHKAALSAADEKVTVLEDKVSQTANKVNAEPDTVKSKIPDCDSLSRETLALIKQAGEQDSLCNTTINELTTQVDEKDSVINDCNESYVSMRQTLDTSLVQQENMAGLIKNLNKEVKKKVIQSRILSAGILILSGISATLYLTRKP